jgi:hypothetical protein
VWLRKHVDRPGFLPVASLVSAADFFLPILPTQSVLVGSTLLRPQRWRRIALAFVLGGALGGTALAACLQFLAPTLTEALLPTANARLEEVRAFLGSYGALGLFLLTIVPWPMRSGVAVCALAGVPLLHILLALLAGRSLGFGGLAFLISRGSRVLENWSGFRRLRSQVHDLEVPRATRPLAVALVLAVVLGGFDRATATERSGEAVLADGRTLQVVDRVEAMGAFTREYRDAAGSVITTLSARAGADPRQGVVAATQTDFGGALTLSMQRGADGMGLRLVRNGVEVTRRVETFPEPVLVASLLAEWVRANWEEFARGGEVIARFPIAKAGKTLRIRARPQRAETAGGLVVVLRPTNPVFALLADPIELRFDATRQLVSQSGLAEPLGGTAAAPSLQSGRLSFRAVGVSGTPALAQTPR